MSLDTKHGEKGQKHQPYQTATGGRMSAASIFSVKPRDLAHQRGQFFPLRLERPEPPYFVLLCLRHASSHTPYNTTAILAMIIYPKPCLYYHDVGPRDIP
eukprot:240332_1